MLVFLFNRRWTRKEKLEKWRAKEEERHKGSLILLSNKRLPNRPLRAVF
jgi:hypothetical protein